VRQNLPVYLSPTDPFLLDPSKLETHLSMLDLPTVRRLLYHGYMYLQIPWMRSYINMDIALAKNGPLRLMPAESFDTYAPEVSAALDNHHWRLDAGDNPTTYIDYIVTLFMEIARRCGPTIFQLTPYATKVRGITAMCDIIDIMDRVAGDFGNNLRAMASRLKPHIVAVARSFSREPNAHWEGPIPRLQRSCSNGPYRVSIGEAAGIDQALRILLGESL
jgi:hypothetical protein